MSFIVIEGFYSVGKTCIMRKLKEVFSEAIFIKEGGTFEGKEIRRLINSNVYQVEEETKSLLYVSSLYEIFRKIIYLNMDKLIFCERWDTFLCAQMYAKNIDPRWAGDPFCIKYPDLNILIHAPFRVCIERLKKTQNGRKLIFSYSEETLWKMHDYYYLEAEGIQVDGNRGISEVVKDIISLVGYANGERTIT